MTEPQTNETAGIEKSENRLSTASEIQEYAIRGSLASVTQNQVKAAVSTSSLVKPTESQVEDSMMRSQMYSEDALRATSAGAALAKAGQILRGTGNQYMDGKVIDHYKKSFKVKIIDYFWSHSWRANALHKVCTLLFFHNGSKAVSAAIIAALLASITAWPNRWVSDTRTTTTVFALIFGQVGFWVTLLCWRSSSTVFLDKICIHQTDAKLKEAGIKSLGGFLRHSWQMLILFDDSYLSRLWCVFEVATLLNLRDAESSIVIEPVRTGPITLFVLAASNVAQTIQVGFRMAMQMHGIWDDSMLGTVMIISFAVAVPFMIWVVPFWRAFVRETSNAKKQVSEFSFDNSRCFCCDNNHIFPGSGAPIPCDRDGVRQCIHAWFGTTENFDDFTRRSVGQQFALAGLLTYTQCFAVSLSRICFFIGNTLYVHSDISEYEQGAAWLESWYYLCSIFSFQIGLNICGRMLWWFNKAPLHGWKGWVINSVCVLLVFIVNYAEQRVIGIVYGIGTSYMSAFPIFIFICIITIVLIFPDIRKSCRSVLGRNKGKSQTQSAFDQHPKSEPEPKEAVEGKLENAEAELEIDAQLSTGGKIDMLV